MVLLKMLGFLDLSDSEMLRLGDKIRRSFRREIAGFLKQEFIRDLAIGTTQGNLSPARRSIYLPLLLAFLERLLTSVLDPGPATGWPPPPGSSSWLTSSRRSSVAMTSSGRR